MPSPNDSGNGNTRPPWNTTRIGKLVEEKFQKRACLFQIKTAMALYEGKDVVKRMRFVGVQANLLSTAKTWQICALESMIVYVYPYK